MPTQSPAKDLRKTSAGALFGQGREMGSARPTERPRKALQRSVRCCWSYFAVSRSIWAKNKGSTRYADAPLARETDICTRPEGACGPVRAMPEHSTCRGCFVVLSAYRVDASDDGPVMGLSVDHLVESVFRQLASQSVQAVWLLDDVAVGSHPRLPETARRGDERMGQVQVGCEVAHMSGSPLSLYGFAFSALADGSRLYGIEALIHA